MGKPRRVAAADSGAHGNVVYCLSNGKQTYVGVTNDMKRRLRQHNGELKGGARYTTLNKHRGTLGRWVLAFLVTGFKKRSDALKLEWRLHGHPPRPSEVPPLKHNPYRHLGVAEARRAHDLQRVLAMKRVTRSATPTDQLQLCVYWRDAALYQCVSSAAEATWPASVRHRHAQPKSP
jgi:predicted GIY-YIG superfamily endonuclease